MIERTIGACLPYRNVPSLNVLAESGEPHTIGEELILPARSEVLSIVLYKSPRDIIKVIPLSNNSVQRCIDEMAKKLEDLLCISLRITEFALQLNEATLPGNKSASCLCMLHKR